MRSIAAPASSRRYPQRRAVNTAAQRLGAKAAFDARVAADTVWTSGPASAAGSS